MKHCRIKRGLACMAMIGLGIGVAVGAEMLLVEKGISKVPIMVAADAPAATTQAVDDLARYLEKISGAKLEILVGAVDPTPESAIWVGSHPNLDKIFPKANLEFTYPEEILNLCNGKHLLIAGRDRMAGTNQVEGGTANAVYTFIQKYLGVRWFWPNPLGLDIPKNETLAFGSFDYRFHPLFRQRKLYPGRPPEWDRFQRLGLVSYAFKGGHANVDWWEKYHEEHPDYFALQPDGTRDFSDRPKDAKLCVSNPKVAEQWLSNAEEKLREDPTLLMLSATPNDGPGFCTCENCRAWDHPDGPKTMGWVALTDRYVRYWNLLGQGLKERFPGREVYVSAAAYSTYKTPPVAAVLADNIAMSYAGSFPLANDEVTQSEQQAWLGWSKQATGGMVFRPNLFHYSGGWLGLPTLALQRTIKDFRFLAENKCVGLTVDTLPHCWATAGAQYYLMIQLAYDPLQDGQALLQDFYQRGFGPAAKAIEEYCNVMEQAHEQILKKIKISGAFARKATDVFREVYTDEVLGQARHWMDQAAILATDGPEVYQQRVAFYRAGYAFTQVQVEIMRAMAQVRESQGKDTVAVQKATELCEQRDVMEKENSFGARYATWYREARKLDDYLGPPSEELLKAKHDESFKLHPAEWSLAFSDDFQRAEPGPEWEVKRGTWTVEEGCLTTRGEGTIMMARSFPGLQKIEFETSVTPNPGISDVSPFIQTEKNKKQAGYFLRFGGNRNTASGILRKGEIVQESERIIEPNKTHKVVAEYDGEQVRLIVDGEIIAAFFDDHPLVGEGHDRIGFYTYEGIIKIRNVKVFTARAVRLTNAELPGYEGRD